MRLLDKLFTRKSGILLPFPGGIVVGPDAGASYGDLSSIAAINEDAWTLINFNSNSQTPTLTAAFIVGNLAGVLDYTGAPGGAVTVTTDTAANILNGLPAYVPLMGPSQFQTKWRYLNDGTGQTHTLTAGSGVTVTGTATIANNAWRDFLIIMTAGFPSPAITFRNIGGGTL